MPTLLVFYGRHTYGIVNYIPVLRSVDSREQPAFARYCKLPATLHDLRPRHARAKIKDGLFRIILCVSA